MKNMRNMKTLSRTLLVLVAVAVVAMNVYGNDPDGPRRGSKSAEYSPVSAYINVRGPVDQQAMLEALTEGYARLATIKRVLLRSVDNDVDDDGKRLDRIKGCKYFTADKKGIIRNLRRDLRVTSVPGTNLIRVSIKSALPSEQALIVNAVADAIVAQAKERYTARIGGGMKALGERLKMLQDQAAACEKEIDKIRGQNPVGLMTARRTQLENSLATMGNTLTSLRLQKARAEADYDTFTKGHKGGKPAESPEIRSEIAKDPAVAELRSAILKLKIAAMGEKDSKQLADIQRKLQAMLAARRKEAAGEAIELKSSRLRAKVTSIRESILTTGNLYTECSARLHDLSFALGTIKKTQSRMARIEPQISELQDKILQHRIAREDVPLTLMAPAETR